MNKTFNILLSIAALGLTACTGAPHSSIRMQDAVMVGQIDLELLTIDALAH
ncbi:MAG: starvation-inducible outer membrane lipoprotein [Paracoccaceae bacterium]|jgi:hypothetical protein